MRVGRAGRKARPHFPDQVARPALSDGCKPVVPTGLKSARQLIAAVPIAARRIATKATPRNQLMGVFAGPLPEKKEAACDEDREHKRC